MRVAVFFFDLWMNVVVGGVKGLALCLWAKASGRVPAPRTVVFGAAEKPVPRIRYGTADVRVYHQVTSRRDYDVVPADSPRLIVDAGAHVGLTTRRFADRFPEATVIAIEPSEANFELLERNTRHLDNVVPLHAALVAESGPVRIENPGAQTWAFQVKPDRDGGGTITGLTVRDVLERLTATRIDILKLDIEGTERELLSRTGDWIAAVEMLLVETHDDFAPGSSRALYAAIGDFPFEWRFGEIAGFARSAPREVPGGGELCEWREGRLV